MSAVHTGHEGFEHPFGSAVVFGAGAIGSLLGARLSKVIPTLLVARGRHMEALRSAPLEIGGLADEKSSVNVAAEPGELDRRAIVLLTVKLKDLASAARELAPKLREDTLLVCLQNGLDPEDILRRELISHGVATPRILRGLVMAGCDLVRPGRIEYWGGGVTLPESADGKAVARLFAEAKVPVSLVGDIRKESWKKFALNCVANALGAILGARNFELVSEELIPIRRAVVEELRMCARDAGVELPDDLAEQIDSALARSQNRNSMLQDIAAGRPTEIEWLNGRVVELAQKAGRDAPTNRALTELVRFMERRKFTRT